MFHGGHYPLALHALDIANGNLAGKIRIFSKILKVAAVHGRAINVHRRPKQKTYPPRTGVVAQHHPHSLRQLRIPTRREADAACIGRRKTP